MQAFEIRNNQYKRPAFRSRAQNPTLEIEIGADSAKTHLPNLLILPAPIKSKLYSPAFPKPPKEVNFPPRPFIPKPTQMPKNHKQGRNQEKDQSFHQI